MTSFDDLDPTIQAHLVQNAPYYETYIPPDQDIAQNIWQQSTVDTKYNSYVSTAQTYQDRLHDAYIQRQNYLQMHGIKPVVDITDHMTPEDLQAQDAQIANINNTTRFNNPLPTNEQVADGVRNDFLKISREKQLGENSENFLSRIISGGLGWARSIPYDPLGSLRDAAIFGAGIAASAATGGVSDEVAGAALASEGVAGAVEGAGAAEGVGAGVAAAEAGAGTGAAAVEGAAGTGASVFTKYPLLKDMAIWGVDTAVQNVGDQASQNKALVAMGLPAQSLWDTSVDGLVQGAVGGVLATVGGKIVGKLWKSAVRPVIFGSRALSDAAKLSDVLGQDALDGVVKDDATASAQSFIDDPEVQPHYVQDEEGNLVPMSQDLIDKHLTPGEQAALNAPEARDLSGNTDDFHDDIPLARAAEEQPLPEDMSTTSDTVQPVADVANVAGAEPAVEPEIPQRIIRSNTKSVAGRRTINFADAIPDYSALMYRAPAVRASSITESLLRDPDPEVRQAMRERIARSDEMTDALNANRNICGLKRA